jgi:hypothetical protein
MKRAISAVAGIALVTAACQDFNTPSAESPEAPTIEAAPESDQVQAAASSQLWAVEDLNGNLIAATDHQCRQIGQAVRSHLQS